MSSMLPKIPRFYVNELEYLQTNGYQFNWAQSDFHPVFRTLPVIPQSINNFGEVNMGIMTQVLNLPNTLNNPFIFALGTEAFTFLGNGNGGILDANNNNIAIGDTNINICMGAPALDGWSLITTAEGVDIASLGIPFGGAL